MAPSEELRRIAPNCAELRAARRTRPEWKSLPVAFRCHVIEPAVPMHGCESAQSTQITGPPRMPSIFPLAIS